MCQSYTFLKPYLIVIILLFLYSNQTQSSTVSFNANQKYSFVGRFVVNIAAQRLSMGTSDWSSVGPNLTVALPQSIPISNISRYDCSANIGEFQSYSLSMINIFIQRYNLNQSQAQFAVKTCNSSLMSKLTISYIIYLKENQQYSYFQIMAINQSIGAAISNNSLQFVRVNANFTYPINQSNSFKGLIMISGICTQSLNNIHDIVFSSNILNSTNFQIIISSKSQKITILNKVLLIIIVYAQSNQSNLYRFYAGTISPQSEKIYSKDYQMTGLNTFVGLTAFSLYNQSQMSFFISVNQSNGIEIKANYPFGVSNSLNFTYLIIHSYYCDYKNPFLEQSSQTCYSDCPGSTTKNNKNLSCQCWINGSLTNNSFCISTQANSSSQGNFQMVIIIGGVVGGIVFVGCFIFILCYCYKKSKKDDDKSSKYTNSIRKTIIFDSSHISYNSSMTFTNQSPLKSLNQLPVVAQNQNIVDVEPIFYRADWSKRQQQAIFTKRQDIKQNQRPRQQYYKRQTKWIKAQKKHESQQMCSTCLQNGTFLESSCRHSFHLKHLFQWLKKKNTCPNCRREFESQFKYFCNLCCLKYHLIRSDQLINEKEFQRICGDCPA